MDKKQQAEEQYKQAIDNIAQAVGEHEAKGGDAADILDQLHVLTNKFSDEGKVRHAKNAISDAPQEALDEIGDQLLAQMSDEQVQQLLARVREKLEAVGEPLPQTETPPPATKPKKPKKRKR
jgi:hypothetical protein